MSRCHLLVYSPSTAATTDREVRTRVLKKRGTWSLKFQVLVFRNTVSSSVHSRCVHVSTPRAAGLLVGVVKYLLFGLFVLGLNRLRRYLRSKGRGQKVRLISEVYILDICI